VFGEPDGQAFYDQNEQYEEFTETAIAIATLPPITSPSQKLRIVSGTPGWVLSLDRSWVPCTVRNGGRFLATGGAEVESGMSGSPILNSDGFAIGLISTSSNTDQFNRHPSLADCLPTWLARLLITPRRT
jgi:hypothetical protein